MISILLSILCLVISSASYSDHTIRNTLEENLELERKLKLINKPPIKSIHTNFGDIIDCIDITKQPAFDHPLLKNHKLQRKPSIQKSIGKTNVKNLPARSIFGIENEPCPKGTVPIQRITKDDLIRDRSLLNDHIMTQDIPGLQRAEVVVSSHGPYYGVSGITSIYNPKVDNKDQYSASHLWIQNGPIDATNKIVAGWHVVPRVYGNNATYFYVAWTSDNFKKTGCFNVRCPGFVQTIPGFYVGYRVNKTSTYDGETMDTRFSIYQDKTTKNWWLSMEDTNIGYFPAELFSNMASGADQVGWGGRTKTPSGTLSPQMGSGHFPDGDFTHACYFKDCTVKTASGNDHFNPDEAKIFIDNSKCFDVKYYESKLVEEGYSIHFGGPGGDCGN